MITTKQGPIIFANDQLFSVLLTALVTLVVLAGQAQAQITPIPLQPLDPYEAGPNPRLSLWETFGPPYGLNAEISIWLQVPDLIESQDQLPDGGAVYEKICPVTGPCYESQLLPNTWEALYGTPGRTWVFPPTNPGRISLSADACAVIMHGIDFRTRSQSIDNYTGLTMWDSMKVGDTVTFYRLESACVEM